MALDGTSNARSLLEPRRPLISCALPDFRHCQRTHVMLAGSGLHTRRDVVLDDSDAIGLGPSKAALSSVLEPG